MLPLYLFRQRKGGVLHVIIKFIELILSVEAIIISYYICKRLDRQNKGG